MHGDAIGEAAALGRDNLEVVELIRRHCRHARIELVNGTSPVGAMLDLPIGLLEVRCQHAPPPRVQGARARELAIEFYEENCRECPYRDGTGELPNLATAAAERAVEIEAGRAALQAVADERERRHQDRRGRRRRLLAGEGHVVRDLAEAVERIDRAEPRAAVQMTPDQEQATRNILDAAREAPHLFRPVLVDSLVELAEDTADPTALLALGALVRSAHCSPRRVLEVALAVLAHSRSAEAGRLIALLEPELRPTDLPGVLDQLIDLTSGDELGPWRQDVSWDGLIAAGHVDLPAVTERVVEHLGRDDERMRQAGADAARFLIQEDPTRIVALGTPLAASVRGPEQGWAGYPHPTSAALQALAEGWRGEPKLTRQVVEDAGAVASQAAKDELSRTPGFLQRIHRPSDALDQPTTEAVSFFADRVGGDWGDEAADHAAENLRSLAHDVPEVVALQIQAVLGAVLGLCAPEEENTAFDAQAGVSPVLAALELQSAHMRRSGRRRRLADTIGLCAKADPSGVLASVQGLFSATTGDAQHDRTVRVTMLDVLEKAVSAETLRDILPVTYSALLDTDQSVRGAGVDLWAACVGVADALPDELNALAQPLLEDSYVIVHRRMLERLPYLNLPEDLAPDLVRVAAHWVQYYATVDKTRSDVLDSAIRALRSLARQLPDEAQVTGWYAVALAFVDGCEPHDRERLLSAWWPDEIRDSPAWTRAVLSTAASPELIDYYNSRHEPLLQSLMDRPQLLAGLAFGEIEPLSSVHSPGHPWRALEPVELLQSAARWGDAAVIARDVGSRQPPGDEGEPGRQLAGMVARSAELNEGLAAGRPTPSDLDDLLSAVATSVAELKASLPQDIDDTQVRHTVAGIEASATAARVLLDSLVAEPAIAADELDGAAELLSQIPPAHAAGAQRQVIAASWKIAATLLRYDASIRAARSEAPILLQSARRQAEVLRAELETKAVGSVPDGVAIFASVAAEIGDPGAAQDAWRQLGCVPPPVSLVGTDLLPRRFASRHAAKRPEEPPRAVCVATMRGVPVTDILVLRRDEVYQLGMTVRLLDVPDWAEKCVVEPVSMLGREVLALPRYELSLSDGVTDEAGITLGGEAPLHCGVEQPIRGPALDCPLQVHLAGGGREVRIEVAGLQRLRIRPFDPSTDTLTEHEQTDARLLKMFAALDSDEFDSEDARAFCRLFAACVRASQTIMFDGTFRRGSKVSEAQFHNELERLLRADPELGGRLTRRDAVAGGYDDLLHDDVIAELKVSSGAPVTVEKAFKYLGQPTQYGVGRGSQLSVLVVFDRGAKEAPPGVIDNYIDWLKPSLHGLSDPEYPSLVGILIVNTNLPVPSAWSRRAIAGERVLGADDSAMPASPKAAADDGGDEPA